MLVFVGIATYDGKVCAATTDALLAETVLGYDQGVHFLVQWVIGHCYLGLARDLLAERFLSIPQAKSLVMLDSDISWKAGDLLKLVRYPHDVIGATYRPKRDEERYHARQPIERVGDLYRVGGLPGGFVKIERHVFSQLKLTQFEHQNRIVRDFFPVGERNGVYFGEDYGFCELWREAGGSVWLDPSIHLKHHDGGRYFTGDPSEWLRKAALWDIGEETHNGIADRSGEQPGEEDLDAGTRRVERVGDIGC